MKKILNVKFALLTIVIALLFIFLHALTVNLSSDARYIHFLSTTFIILVAYFLTISFSEKLHRWRSALILVFGVIIITTISHLINYDKFFIIRIIALLVGLLLISVTFFDRIKNWFIE